MYRVRALLVSLLRCSVGAFLVLCLSYFLWPRSLSSLSLLDRVLPLVQRRISNRYAHDLEMRAEEQVFYPDKVAGRKGAREEVSIHLVESAIHLQIGAIDLDVHQVVHAHSGLFSKSDRQSGVPVEPLLLDRSELCRQLDPLPDAR